MLGRDVQTAISNALEASFYVAPETPGLMLDELAEVLRPLNYGPGDIGDALRTFMGSRVGGTVHGYWFASEELPFHLTDHSIPFDGDPRDWDVFAFVQARLQRVASDHGLAQAKLGVSELYLEGEQQGMDAQQLRLAVRGLALMELARFDAELNTIALTEKGKNWALVNRRSERISIQSRQGFAELVERVRQVRERRDPVVRWRALRAELETVELVRALTVDESRVLGDICAHFADDGQPVALDDVQRRVLDLDVYAIVNAQLEPKAQLHARPDGCVLPSLLAVHRHLDLFSKLLLLGDTALKKAKELWERKNVAVSLQRDLLATSRPGSSVSVENRQLGLLIDALSLAPVLVPQAGDRIEIRDQIRHTHRIVSLMAERERASASVPTAISDGPGARRKQDKFGILDSPRHYETDFADSVGAFGVAVVFFDLDGFKQINTRFTEPVVDRTLLPEIQRLVQALTAKRGFAYAEGGDEFVITLPNTDIVLAEAFTKVLLEKIRTAEFSVDGTPVRVTASAGIATSMNAGDGQRCREAASLAKRHAKEQGKDRHSIATALPGPAE